MQETRNLRSRKLLLLPKLLSVMTRTKVFGLLLTQRIELFVVDRHMFTTCLNLIILHSSPAYQSNCLQLELPIDYQLLNPFCFGALPSLGLPRILAQYKYFIYYYYIIIIM